MTMTPQTAVLLNELCRMLGIVVDWSDDDIVPYLTQIAEKYISWETATSQNWLVAGIAMCVLGIWIVYMDLHAWKEDLPTIGGAVLVLVGLVVIGAQINDILACKYWPEKAIADYLAWRRTMG